MYIVQVFSLKTIKIKCVKTTQWVKKVRLNDKAKDKQINKRMISTKNLFQIRMTKKNQNFIVTYSKHPFIHTQ